MIPLTKNTFDNISKFEIEKREKKYLAEKRKRQKELDKFEELFKKNSDLTDETNKQIDNKNSFQFSFLYSVYPNHNFDIHNYKNMFNYESRYLLFYFYNEKDIVSQELLLNYGGKINNISDSIDLITIYDLECLNSWGKIKGYNRLHKTIVEDNGDYNRFQKLNELGRTLGVNPWEYPALVIYDLEEKSSTISFMKDCSALSIYEKIKNIITKINENFGCDIDMFGTKLYLEDNLSSIIKDDFIGLYIKYSKKRGLKEAISDALDIDVKTLRSRINSNNIHSLFIRDEIIMMTIIFKLDLDKANEFLYSYHMSEFNPIDKRDSIIIDCLNKRYNVYQVDNELELKGLKKLERHKNRIKYDE